MGINIGEGFFSDCGGNKAILLGIWVNWTMAILFITFLYQCQSVSFVYILE